MFSVRRKQKQTDALHHFKNPKRFTSQMQIQKKEFDLSTGSNDRFKFFV